MKVKVVDEWPATVYTLCMENFFDFDALNPAFFDNGAFIDEVEELETELLEGTFDNETDYADEDGIFGGDDDEVMGCELLLLDDDILD